MVSRPLPGACLRAHSKPQAAAESGSEHRDRSAASRAFLRTHGQPRPRQPSCWEKHSGPGTQAVEPVPILSSAGSGQQWGKGPGPKRQIPTAMPWLSEITPFKGGICATAFHTSEKQTSAAATVFLSMPQPQRNAGLCGGLWMNPTNKLTYF